MCGRYIIRQQTKALREWEKYGPPPFLESYNVAPSQEVPVLRMHAGHPEYALLRWGLIPYFAHGVPPKYSTINARIETLETAAYREPWRRGRRCLQLPRFTSGTSTRGRKGVADHLADQELFASRLQDRSIRKTARRWRAACTWLATPLADIRNGGINPQRMPAILHQRTATRGLGQPPGPAPFSGSTRPTGCWLGQPWVNSVRNDSSDLLAPASGRPEKRLAASGARRQMRR
jgi:hypothetical protein